MVQAVDDEAGRIDVRRRRIDEGEVRQFTIGALANHAGVSVHTILYYERRGLLPKGRRSASGYRLFSMDAVRRIAFIKRSKQLGFTLKEIRDIIALRVPGATCDAVHERILAKVDDIDARLRTLRSARKQLLGLAAECTNGRPLSECDIVRRLERAGAPTSATDGRRTG